MSRCGGLGGIFNNDTILWFILLFLLLFFNSRRGECVNDVEVC
ncbi:MAG: hypothetical protein Q8942_08620 [Bacillota bacterium]|nr:hypothetical protein [Bacillota bacterium]